MKNRKLLRTWGLLASTTMLLPLVAGSLGTGLVADAATEGTTDIIINKVVYEADVELPDEVIVTPSTDPEKPGSVTGNVKNDGSELDFFDGVERLENAEFTMYDVTDKYWAMRAADTDAEIADIFDDIIEAGATDLGDGKAVRTDADGKAVFPNTPNFTDEGKTKVYMIVETDAPPFTDNWSQSIVVMLPFYNSANEELDTVNLYPKNTKVGIEKSVDIDEADFNHINVNGEIVPVADFEKGAPIKYDIEFMMPFNIAELNESDEKLYTQFDIVDTPTANLEYNSLETPAFQVFDGTAWVTADAILATDYTVAPNGNGFTLSFKVDEEGVLDRLATYKGQQIRLNYIMNLNENATPEKVDENTAKIEFTHNGKQVSDTDPGEKVITGGHHFIKYDASKGKTPLGGAEFVVGRTNESTTEYAIFKDSDGAMLPKGSNTNAAASIEWTTDKKDATTLVSDATDGTFSVNGLAYGKYFVEETKAPEGFVTPANPISDFDVNESSYVTSLENPTEVEFTDPKEIANYPKGALPSTGGTGIFAFLAVGTALMMGAYLWFKNSKKQEV